MECKIEQKVLCAVHWNPTSMRGKKDEFYKLVKETNPSVIGLVQTNAPVTLNGFKTYDFGLANHFQILVANGLEVKDVKLVVKNDQLQLAEVVGERWSIGYIYIWPGVPKKRVVNQLTPLIWAYDIILGDFNINLEKGTYKNIIEGLGWNTLYTEDIFSFISGSRKSKIDFGLVKNYIAEAKLFQVANAEHKALLINTSIKIRDACKKLAYSRGPSFKGWKRY